MPRFCKCQLCKANLTVDIAFKRMHNGKNLYYCSQSEYEEFENAKQNKLKVKEEIINLLCAILC